MRSSEAGTVVAVEILMEKEVVAKMRIAVKLVPMTKSRPTAVGIAEEDPGKPIR